MNVLEAIEARRSVKHYDPEHRMTEEEIEKLLDLTIKSPTAFNIQHWRLVVVRDPELRKQIRAHSWDQAQVTDASLLIILCADVKAWDREPARYWKDAPQQAQDMLVPMITKYYEGREPEQRDECLRSCGIAGQTIMLAAKGMGLDSCPMDGFDFDAVGKLIHLPDDHMITYMITVGKAVQPAWPRPGQLPLSEIVVTDRF